jgi:hypothetical protein
VVCKHDRVVSSVRSQPDEIPRHRCVRRRLGRNAAGALLPGTVVRQRTTASHQRKRTTGGQKRASAVRPPAAHKGGLSSTGQSHRCRLHSATRRYQVDRSPPDRCRSPLVVPAALNPAPTALPPRSPELVRRRPQPSLGAVYGVAPPSSGGQCGVCRVGGTTPPRPVRLSSCIRHHPVRLARSDGSSSSLDGCVLSSVGVPSTADLVLPSPSRHPPSPTPTPDGGRGFLSGDTGVEGSSLASRSPAFIQPGTDSDQTTEQLPDRRPDPTASTSDLRADSTRLEDLLSGTVIAGLSAGACSLQSAAWKPSTQATYGASWKQWLQFCSFTPDILVRAPSPIQFANFISYLFHEKNLLPSTVRNYKSGVLQLLTDEAASRIANDRTLVRVLKGLDSVNPPIAKLSIWSIDRALVSLQSYRTKSSITDSLFRLTCHLLFLLVVLGAKRPHDVSRLSVASGHIFWNEQGVQLLPTFGSKTDKATWRQSPSQYLNNDCLLLSVPDLLRLYLAKTRLNRGACTVLFVDPIQPSLPLSRHKISVYLRKIMSELCIFDTPGSGRSAAATAALLKGVTLDDVLNLGNWRSATTVEKFYFRP